MPLENNTGWIDKLANSLTARISSAGSNTTDNCTIVVKIGEDTIIQRVIKGINKQQRAAGKTLITV
jgi:hypothetical protein